ncbi:hypothetical protein [Kitasatospora sp. NPDC051914]|uniref:hypothetical protein n=1 Tax=Kitasatospora sp. NPDC051914 TaxID=3154945 RepID=UPI00343DD4E2
MQPGDRIHPVRAFNARLHVLGCLRVERITPYDGDADPLERLTYISRRGERTLDHVEDGRLLRAVGVQGVYRLSPASAKIHTLLQTG